jgi:hypothetical protein
MPRKNPHAVALGTKGGQARTPKKIAAARVNARKAGRKPKWRIEELDDDLYLRRRVSSPLSADEWEPVTTFTPAALVYVATWLREHRPKTQVTAISEGAITHRKA